VARELDAGHRAFVVVPLVEDDEEAGATSVGVMADRVRAALPDAATAQRLMPREYRVGHRPRAAQGRRARHGHGRVPARRPRRARRHDGARGRRGRPRSDRDGDRGRGALRRRTAPPAARARRTRRGGVVLRARLRSLPSRPGARPRHRRAGGGARTTGRGRRSTATASCSRSSTWSSVARASSSD
jgi:hypothetical protein